MSIRLRTGLLLCALSGLLAGCAAGTLEQAPPAPAPGAGEVPEITLNLPQQDCVCPGAGAPDADYTFLEKGYRALAAGEHIEAVQYFQRYRRMESSPRAQWEAAIAIAYVSLLPRSPYYDPEAARASFQGLRRQSPKDLGAEDYTRLMRQALLNILALEREIEELRSRNASLQETLDKREEALKRLRELTLGQKGSSP